LRFQSCFVGFQGFASRKSFLSSGRHVVDQSPWAKPRNKKVDLENANTAIDRHCEEPLRRSNPEAAYCGPWIFAALAMTVELTH
jgi:hypothetical protein